MGIYGYKKIVKAPPEIHEMKALIDKWREPELVQVDSRTVVPDSSNRGHTGLSVDHCHLLATMFLKDGFRPRAPDFASTGKQGHDIPVLVRGSLDSPVSAESLSFWRSAVEREADFPRARIDGRSGDWFTSLGNGHFMQALNLHHEQVVNLFTGERFRPNPDDSALLAALRLGVQSIVLRPEMPVHERRRLAILLNQTHSYKWGVDRSGQVDVREEACANARYTLFEAESKQLDTGDLSMRLRLELGLKTSDRSPITARDFKGNSWYKSKQLEHLGLGNGRGAPDPRSKL